MERITRHANILARTMVKNHPNRFDGYRAALLAQVERNPRLEPWVNSFNRWAAGSWPYYLDLIRYVDGEIDGVAAWYFEHTAALMTKVLSVAEDGAAIVWSTSLPVNHIVATLLHYRSTPVSEQQARAYLEPFVGGMQ